MSVWAALAGGFVGTLVLTTALRAANELGLTPRQREVLRLIADGRTMKEVAALLGLSPRTVETHKYQVMEALGVGTTAELVRYALEHGLATPPSDRPPNR